MNRFVIAFWIILLTKICSFSQNISKNIINDSIITITSDQLKITNLIFVEHKQLLNENKLLNQQINTFKNKVNLLEYNDSIREKQLNTHNELNNLYKVQIQDLESEIDRKNNIIKCLKIGGITIGIGLSILLLIK